jgi:hypothetical protein
VWNQWVEIIYIHTVHTACRSPIHKNKVKALYLELYRFCQTNKQSITAGSPIATYVQAIFVTGLARDADVFITAVLNTRGLLNAEHSVTDRSSPVLLPLPTCTAVIPEISQHLWRLCHPVLNLNTSTVLPFGIRSGTPVIGLSHSFTNPH